jgi:hypothetical protein
MQKDVGDGRLAELDRCTAACSWPIHDTHKQQNIVNSLRVFPSFFYFLFSRRQNATTITLFFFSPFSWAPKCWTEKLFFAPLPAPEMGETTDRFQSIAVVVVDVAPFYWHEIMRVQWKMVAITLSRLFLHRGYLPSHPPRNLWCVDEEKTQTIRIMADVDGTGQRTNRARRTPINTSWLS